MALRLETLNLAFQQQIDYFERIKAMNLKSKLIIGFGISENETCTTACKYSSDAIIGSAFIKALDKNGIIGIGDFTKSILS